VEAQEVVKAGRRLKTVAGVLGYVTLKKYLFI
jgi:hypothetical protein